MHVLPCCYIVVTVLSKYSVTDDDVRNIETYLINLKKCCHLLKRHFFFNSRIVQSGILYVKREPSQHLNEDLIAFKWLELPSIFATCRKCYRFWFSVIHLRFLQRKLTWRKCYSQRSLKILLSSREIQRPPILLLCK